MEAGLVLALALAVAPEGEGGRLRWRAPAGCPDETEMAARMAAAGGLGALSVDATVTRHGEDAWRLELVLDLDGERDTRVLRGSSCASLAEAAELLIAVRRDATSSDPAALPEPPPSDVADPGEDPAADTPGEPLDDASPPDDASPSDDASRPNAAPPEVRADAAASPAEPRRPARRMLPSGLHLGVAAGIGLGAMPRPSAPVELVVGWSWPWVRVALRGRYHPPRRVGLGDDRFARLQLGAAGIETCLRPAVRRLELPVCGQAAVGGSRADGTGPRTRDRAGLWVEAGLDAGVAWHLTPVWALTARLGAAAVLVGTRYVLDGMEVFAPAPVAGRLVFGVEVHLPIQIGPRPEKG